MAYNTFEFDDGTNAGTSIVVNGTGTIPFTDDGVDFTFSIDGTQGTHSNKPGTGTQSFDGALTGSIGTFTLSGVTSGAGTKNLFSGTGTQLLKVAATTFSGNLKVTFVHATSPAKNHVTTKPGNSATFTAPAGEYSSIAFTTSTFFLIDTISANMSCFLGGTRIATEAGDVAVENLSEGDRVRLANGALATVRWIGVQQVPARFLHPAKVNPICITAGALADGVPARDLFLSADHGVAVGGLLINAGALVNGRSIYQVEKMPLDGFTYYHVETDAHELLLAEECAAESFIDYAGRGGFDNGDIRAEVPAIPEMDMTRISAARLVPETIKNQLAQRAEWNRAA